MRLIASLWFTASALMVGGFTVMLARRRGARRIRGGESRYDHRPSAGRQQYFTDPTEQDLVNGIPIYLDQRSSASRGLALDD